MTDTSLSSLYRRLTAAEVGVPALDAADLAAAADGTLATERREIVANALAASPSQTRIVRMLRELSSESAKLASDAERTQRGTTHRRHQHADRRIASGRRLGGAARWAGALAACFVAIIGVWTQHRLQTRESATTTNATTVARTDEIFTSRDHIFTFNMDSTGAHGTHNAPDRLFHSSFSGG